MALCCLLFDSMIFFLYKQSVVDMETSDSPMPSSSTSSSSTSSSSSEEDPFEDAAESLSSIDDEDVMFMDTEITNRIRSLSKFEDLIEL